MDGGQYAISNFHHNSLLQKGKAIALPSAEIKIVRTEVKTPIEEFSHQVISCLIKLLLQRLTWNYLWLMDGHGLVPI